MKFNKLLLVIFCAVLSIFLFNTEVKASHAQGLEINYQCIGQDSFMVSLNFYRDCIGVNAPSAVTVNISSGSCAQTISAALVITNPGGTEVSQICAAQISNSSCNGGGLAGTQLYSFEGLVIIPSGCNDWTFEYSLCCRNAAIDNIQSGSSEAICVQTMLNSLNVAQCNSNPIFTNQRIVPYVCVNQEVNYNPGAVDLDGDSLVFSSVTPLGTGCTPITYVSPFSPSNPLPSSTPFTINAETGQLNFTPTTVGNYVITVLVQEYRNGLLVGTTMRDIQFVVQNCTNTAPVLVQGITPIIGGSLIDSLSIEVCPGEPLVFTFIVGDPDGNAITITDNVGNAIPGATVIYSYPSQDTIIGTFEWIATAFDTGVNSFTIIVADNECPIPGEFSQNFKIFVRDGTFAGPDLFYCSAGDSVQLYAVGGTAFTWTPSTGLNDPNIRDPKAAVNQTITYIVTSDLSPVCDNTDSLTVFLVPNFIQNIIPDQDSIDFCRNESVQLDVFTDSIWGPFTFVWSPGETLMPDSAIRNPFASPLVTTDYIVTVTSDTGCVLKDTLTLNAIGNGPLVIVEADNNNVCPGDTVQLTTNVYPLSCGPALNPCSAQNPPSPKTLGNSTTGSFETPFEGNGFSHRYQALYKAADLNAVNIYSGTIQRIGLEISSKTSQGVYENFEIKIGCTNEENLDITAGWLPTSLTVVSSAAVVINTGWNNFNFNPQFDWDGVSNLVVEICWTTSSGNPIPGGNDNVFVNNKNYIASMRSEAATSGDGCSKPPVFQYTVLPNTMFFTCDAALNDYTYTWTPTTNLSDDTIPNPTVVVNATETYSVLVEDSICAGSDFITLTIDTSYSIEIVGDTSICADGDSIQLGLQFSGNVPVNNLPCGVNGTPCFNPPHVDQLGTQNLQLSHSEGSPFIQFWEDGRLQYLVKAAELQGLGLTSGTITQLAFNVLVKQSTDPWDSYQIKIGCTSLTQLPANDFANVATTTVYGPVPFSSTQGWNTFTLNQSFDWDGTSNLIIEVCSGIFSWTSTDIVAGSNAGFRATVYRYSDQQGASTCNLTVGSFGTEFTRPNMRFTICDAPQGTAGVAWSPNSGISDTTSETPWVSPDSTTTYYMDYTFVNGCVRSDSITIHVNQIITTLTNDTAICIGDSIQLLATGGATYDWVPGASLSCNTCPDPIAFPVITTSYIVNIVDSGGCSAIDTVTVTVNPLPTINFGLDSILCFVDSFRLSAGAGFSSYLWYPNGDTTPSINVTVAGTYAVDVVDTNGCESSDSVDLIISQAPTVDLGPDTTLCSGDTVLLSVPNVYSTYEWFPINSTDTSILVFDTWDYSIRVTDTAGCPAYDTVSVVFNVVDIDLGPDRFECSNINIYLIAGPDIWSYLWQDESTTDSFFLVTSPGFYGVGGVDSFGCFDYDEVVIGLYPDQALDLGPDTFLCASQPLTYSAPGYSIYNWSTGSTTSSTIVFSTNPGTTDTLTLEAIDSNGCTYNDTVLIEDRTPAVNLGPDTTFCFGLFVTLDAGAGFDSYQWSTSQQDITQYVDIDISGTYSVTVENAGCFASDVINVSSAPPAEPDLGFDQSICPGATTDLYPGNFATYIWSVPNNGADILTVDQAGVYSVTVTSVNGCVGTDEIEIFDLNPTPLVMPDLGRCLTTDVVTAYIVDSVNYIDVQWSNTSDSVYSVDLSVDGTYSVTVTDEAGCEVSASFEVFIMGLGLDAFVVNPANTDTINRGESATLGTNFSDSLNFSFAWEPALTLDNTNTPYTVATPDETTYYFVMVTNEITGCNDIDSVTVFVNAFNKIPTAFSPNGDGVNDEFYYIGNAEVLKFEIYNRWGELLHGDAANGWDGNYKGKPQPVGTYVYVLEYTIDGEVFPESKPFSLYR